METLINQMIIEAMAYNRFLTTEFLNSLSPKQIAAFTHPIYRVKHLETIREFQNK